MISAKQNGLYWGEFKDAWAARCSRGSAPANRDQWRKWLHVRAGAIDSKGRPKSSKDFSQRDIDRWKGVCRAYYLGGDLEAQLEIERQPVLRVMAACEMWLEALAIDEDKREAYVAGIYRNVQRKRVREGARELGLHEMPDADLQLVITALKHTAGHKLGKQHRHPHTPYASEGSRAAHAVGSRSGCVAGAVIYVTAVGEAHLRPPTADEPEIDHSRPDPQYVPPPNEAF